MLLSDEVSSAGGDATASALSSPPAERPDSFSSLSPSFSFTVRSNPEFAPGVFGVLTAPKDANAPVPSPNAEEALDGVLAEGVRPLKGFDLFCDELSPVLRPPKPLCESDFVPSLLSESRVESDSLVLELWTER